MPPLRVVEIRVHGVHGTPPEEMLDDPFPVQVAGDDSARFLRRRSWERDGPHVVEAFHWGRFTSGSPTRALWLLLAPFAILNLASFTLLPTGAEPPRAPDSARPGSGSRVPQDWAGGAVRLLVRLLGAVLTATLVLAVARVGLDLVMHQCAAMDGCRRENRWLAPLALGGDGARFAIGLVAPAVVVALVWWLGRQTFLHDPPGRPDDEYWIDSLGDRGFWHTRRLTAPLRSAHAVVACAVLGDLCAQYLGVVRAAATPVDPAVVAPLRAAFGVLALAALVAVARPVWFVADRQPAEPGSVPGLARLLTAVRWAALVLLGVTAAVGAVTTWSAQPVEPGDPAGRAPLPGFDVAADAILSVSAGLLVLLLLFCGGMWVRSGRSASLPRPFRPFWCGFGPALLCALAVTLAGGFSAGLVFWVGNLLGRIVAQDQPLPPPLDPAQTPQWPLRLDASYFHLGLTSGLGVLAFVALLPGLVAALLRAGAVAVWALAANGLAGGAAVVVGAGRARAALLVAVVWLAGAGVAGWWRGWGGGWCRAGLRSLVARDYPRPEPEGTDLLTPATPDVTIDRIATSWRLARSKYRLHWVLGAAAVLGVAGTAATAVLVRLDRPPLAVAGAGIGPAVLSGVAIGLVALGLRSWNNPRLRLGVGILWDLLAFWPRAAHPLCPPPYGGRTVLELAQRAGHLAGGDGQPLVVLSGHSQGSLVCAAAVTVLDRERRDGLHAGPAEFIPGARARTTIDRLGLVTYGSQLQWAYARLFPRYVGFDVLRELYTTALAGRWRNLHRFTDPLGGPVLAWPADGSAAPAERGEADREWTPMAGSPGPVRHHRVGNDLRLVDPLQIDVDPNRVRDPLRGHGDYTADPAYADAVREVGAPSGEPVRADRRDPVS